MEPDSNPSVPLLKYTKPAVSGDLPPVRGGEKITLGALWEPFLDNPNSNRLYLPPTFSSSNAPSSSNVPQDMVV